MGIWVGEWQLLYFVVGERRDLSLGFENGRVKICRVVSLGGGT